VDWCSRPLPEVVRLTADKEEWRRVVTGFNSSQGHELKRKRRTVIKLQVMKLGPAIAL